MIFDLVKIFHDRCDYIKKILVLIKTIKSKKFGEFTEECFDSSTTYKTHDNTFIFQLDNFKNDNIKKEKNAIYYEKK